MYGSLFTRQCEFHLLIHRVKLGAYLIRPLVFISYSGYDKFEAGLFQYAVETLLSKEHVLAWTFDRDQRRSESQIAASLKMKVKQSVATIFLLSPSTLNSGATQWMELAYSDAFDVETFVLLHHLDYQDLKIKDKGVPPLLLSRQCTPATEWRSIVGDIEQLIKKR